MEYICTFCGQKFNRHQSLTRHQGNKCVEYKKHFDNIFSKEFLTKEFFENKKTIKQLIKQVNFGYPQLVNKRIIELKIDIPILNYKCESCGKSFNTINALTGHKRRCKKHLLFKKQNCDKIFTEDFLRNEYENNNRSIWDIIEQYPFGDYRTISVLLEKFGIKKRSISEAKLTNFTKSKYEKTNLDRYGSSHNFNKEHPSRINWENRLFEEEGIINVFQRTEVIEKIAKALSEYKTDPRYGSRISSIHRKVNEYIINELQIKTKLEHKVDRFFYDIFIEPNFIIEVNGDMYHASPKKYKEDDILNNMVFKNVKAKDIWEKDKIKNDKVIENDYKLLILWEHEIKKQFDVVKEKIHNFLGVNSEESKIN